MTAKIVEGSAEVVHRSTYREIKKNERTNQAHISLMEEFDSNIKDRFGLNISPDNCS